MDPGFITLMRKLAPDLIDEITRRALILERIAALQPVGRRQLAAKLNLDPAEIVRKKMKISAQKYPVDKSKGRSTKYDKL